MMYKASLLAASAALACALPANAQDHSGHTGHGSHGDHAEHSAHQHHSGHQGKAKTEVDHCAMGHLPPEQCPPKSEEPKEEGTALDHSAMDHSGHTGHSGSPSHDQHAGHGGQTDHSGHGGHEGHAGHSGPLDKSAPNAAPENAVPARAFEGPRHAADAIWGEEAMEPSREQLAKENGGMKTGMVLIERLEVRIPTDGGHTGYVWDVQGWYGGDINRFVIKSEGEGEIGEGLEDAEIQALFSRAIGPFFDLQAGVRFDPEPEARSHLVLGVQGLAPYWFHVDGSLFLSDKGDLTARVEAEYDQKITQELIVQPRIEVELAAQGIAERGIGPGLTKIEPGVRLRYEITREFAPYVGIEYEAKLGRTAAIARAAGEDPDRVKFLIGIRTWF